MQTDVILISSNGTAMENALAQADLVADYKHLSHQEALHLRLLTEEMVGMMLHYRRNKREILDRG